MSKNSTRVFRKEIGDFVLVYSLIYGERDLKDLFILFKDKELVNGVLDFIEISAGIDAFLMGRMIPGEKFGRFMIPEYGREEKIKLKIELKNGESVYLDRLEATLFNKIARIIDKHINMGYLD